MLSVRERAWLSRPHKRMHPKGVGDGRKAPETGRELMSGFCSTVTGAAESPSLWLAAVPVCALHSVRCRTERRSSALRPRCFLRVQEDTFSGAAICFVHSKKSRKTASFPYSFIVQRRVVASRRVGLCPDFPELVEGKLSLQGLCPKPRKPLEKA